MPKRKLTLDERQSRTFDATVRKYAALMGLDTDKDVADLMGIPHSTYAKRKKSAAGNFGISAGSLRSCISRPTKSGTFSTAL